MPLPVKNTSNDDVIAANASAGEIKAFMRQEMGMSLDGGGTQNNSVVATAWYGQDLGTQSLVSYTQDQMLQAFKLIHDTKFLTDYAGNIRRLSWLYPDDGCYTRAQLGGDIISEYLGLPRPNHVFSFGHREQAEIMFNSTLVARTSNSPVGQVSWWYHVAPIISVAGAAYVLDPAIDPSGPLPLNNWLAAQKSGSGSEVGSVVICDANAYGPGSMCYGDVSQRDLAISEQQQNFLSLEWNRLLELHRDPRIEVLQ